MGNDLRAQPTDRQTDLSSVSKRQSNIDSVFCLQETLKKPDRIQGKKFAKKSPSILHLPIRPENFLNYVYFKIFNGLFSKVKSLAGFSPFKVESDKTL